MITKEIRMAEYWSRFDGSVNECLPTFAELQEYKRVGFNAVMIVEIVYNNQMNDFNDTILPDPINNAFAQCLRQIKNLGMDAHVLFNPGRYGTLHSSGNSCWGGTYDNRTCIDYTSCVGGQCRGNGDINKWKLLSSLTYKQILYNHIKYLIDYNLVDGIQLEEPVFEFSQPDISQQTQVVTDFFKECRTKIPSNIIFSANNPSNGRDTVLNTGHWDLTEINKGAMFDFVAPQPQGEPNGDYPNPNIEGSFASWTGMLPNIPIRPGIYKRSQGKDNPSMLANLEYMASRRRSFQVWPSSSLTSGDLNGIKNVFDMYPLETCPHPQFEFQITQVI